MVRTIYIVLSILLSSFFVLFSLDSESIPGFLIQASPGFAVIIILVLSFRHPRVAALIYGALAISCLWFFSHPVKWLIFLWLAALAVFSILKER